MERFEEALEHLDARVKIPERGYSTQYDKLCEMCRNIDLIEQELGIKLEVLFKALKDGYYVRFVGLPARRLPEYSRFDFYNKKIDECNIKDYGKTWALTREELENAKD